MVLNFYPDQGLTFWKLCFCSQEVPTTVLPPLETVIRDDHRRSPWSQQQRLAEVARLDALQLLDHERVERLMPDIIRTHTCHKCHRIECSCEADISAMAVRFQSALVKRINLNCDVKFLPSSNWSR